MVQRNYSIVGVVDEIPAPASPGRGNPQLAALLAYARAHPGKWVEYESDGAFSSGHATLARKPDFRVAVRGSRRFIIYSPNGDGQ